MTISEMHVWFRQYAQQMGMQNVRAILPEQIDLLINTSITDTINQIIKENIGVTNDRVITDNSKIGQINALRSLYTVKELSCFATTPLSKSKATDEDVVSKYAPINITSDQYTEQTQDTTGTVVGSYYYFSNTVSTLYIYKCLQMCYIANTTQTDVPDASKLVNIIGSDTFTDYFEPVYDSTFAFSSTEANIGKIQGSSIISDYMYLIDFSLNYNTASTGLKEKSAVAYDNITRTNYFPVRLIDDAYLADALNDFVLKNRLRSPILTIYNDTNKVTYFDLYIDKFSKATDNTYYLTNKLLPYKFRVSYIAKPAVVQYAEDISGTSVDCNLPDYMHVDILKHAVDLYHMAISGSLSSTQQQAQAQQQEVTRNNYRNEGTQQNQ